MVAAANIAHLPTTELRARVNAGKRLLAAEKARDSMLAYMKFIRPDPEDIDDPDRSTFIEHPLARLLCQIIEKMDRGEVKRAGVSVGPQFGKSEVLSRGGPAWLSGRNPRRNMILAGYGDTFAAEFGFDCREIMQSAPHKQVFPEHALHPHKQAADALWTTAGGKMAFVGIGGKGTGKPADFFFVDDPIKNEEDARSELFRETNWKWFNGVVFSRVTNETRILIVHCLAGDTLVTMADGSPQRIDQVRPGDYVRAYENGQHVARRVLNWAPQGEDDVFEIRTRNHRVRANGRHPFLVRRNGAEEWVKTADLKKGDVLVSSAVERGCSEAVLTEEQAWLLGFMFGDGWLTKRDTTQTDKQGRTYPRRGIVTCCAMSKYPDLNARVLAAFKALFGVEPKQTKHGYWRTERQDIGQWFAKHGLNGRAKTKQLPNWIFGQPQAVRAAFVKGFSEADGCVDKKGRTTCAAANQRMIAQLRALARGCGLVPSNLYVCRQTVQPPNSKAPVQSECWSFRFSVKRRQEAFVDAPIVSVKPAGRAEVFDIQVEGAESFLADGLVCHNTRWHEDDLLGRLCDPDHPERNKLYKGIAERWTYYNLPAVIDDPKLAKALGLTLEPQTDPNVISMFGTKPISSIWPEKKSLAILAEAKQSDAQTFNALYMGKPSADEGSYFRVQDIVEYERDDLPQRQYMQFYGASDHAVSTDQKRDATVIGCVGVDYEDTIWVMPDLVWDRIETDQTVEEMLMKMQQYRPLLWWMEAELISKSFGPFLKRRMIEERTYTALDPVRPTKDLRTRARAILGRMQQRKVRFPRFAPWWHNAKRELLKFDTATHDDFVAFMALIGLGLTKEVSGAKPMAAVPEYKPGDIRWIVQSSEARKRDADLLVARKGW